MLKILIFTFSIIIFYNTNLANKIEIYPSRNIINNTIKNAKNGDIIILRNGIYLENNIIIDKSITLIGQNGAIIDGSNKDQILKIISDYVVINNITIKNSGYSSLKEISAIRVEKSKHIKIINNKFINNYFGIMLMECTKSLIDSNIMTGNNAKHELNTGNGIHLWNCRKINIRHNKISKHRDGIYFEFVDSSYIINNNSFDNLRYGLHFMYSNNDKYYFNKFHMNGAGVAVMYSKNIDMIANKFYNNKGNNSYGLLLKEMNDSYIKNNFFTDNTIGINAEGINRTKILKNNFNSNGWAIRVTGSSIDGEIIYNNFESNSFEMAFEGEMTSNKISNNYWSKYTGYDIDRNNIGDIPYYPVKLFNFINANVPETIIFIRSLFVDLLNFSEKVAPVITPKNIVDNKPIMTKIKW